MAQAGKLTGVARVPDVVTMDVEYPCECEGEPPARFVMDDGGGSVWCNHCDGLIADHVLADLTEGESAS